MKKIIKIGFLTVLMLAMTLNLSGCKATKNANNKQKGAVIGATSGAVLGGILGNNVGKGGKSKEGALIGGVLGGVAGVLIGNKMDKQAQKIENEIPGAMVERIEDKIIVTFDEGSGVYFGTGEKYLNTSSQSTLDKLANVIAEYPDTNILVEGHTDNVGSMSSNLKLSQDRANAVTRYLDLNKGIANNRITTNWFGETQPVYDNSTTSGRSKNRRVNITIIPNEKMIREAQNN